MVDLEKTIHTLPGVLLSTILLKCRPIADQLNPVLHPEYISIVNSATNRTFYVVLIRQWASKFRNRNKLLVHFHISIDFAFVRHLLQFFVELLGRNKKRDAAFWLTYRVNSSRLSNSVDDDPKDRRIGANVS